MRGNIRDEVLLIEPLDDLEADTKEATLEWIDSGAELCRRRKPATPRKHLVSCSVVVDGEYILLVDHIDAELWLPAGGHVEPGEHPRVTAVRETWEELNIKGQFLRKKPVLLTSSTTVGKTPGHNDISLWYAFAGNRHRTIVYSRDEFQDARWFHKDAIPVERLDPHMQRFVTKLYLE